MFEHPKLLAEMSEIWLGALEFKPQFVSLNTKLIISFDDLKMEQYADLQILTKKQQRKR
jgi:hypothetical protein